MNARLRKLLESRAAAWSKVQDIQARRAKDGYEDTAEDGEAYTRSLDDVEALSKDIEEEERAVRIATALDAIAPDQRSTNPELGAGAGPDVSAQYRKTFDEYMRRGAGRLGPDEQRLLQDGWEEFRAQGTPDAAGGYTVPAEFLNRLNEVRKAYGGIAGLAETIVTASGATLPWPTNDDTGNVGAILDENTAVTEQDMVFGQGSVGAWMYTSKLVRVSLQLLGDTGFDLERWLAGKLGERIGRAAAAHFAVGVGTTQPQGLAVGLTLGVTSAATGVIAYDDLVDLEHAIDPAYRGGTNTRYVIHDTVLRSLRKIKDTTGRPIWVPAIAGGVPSSINGQPYTVDNGLAIQANGSKSVVFGDIRAAYLVREVRGAQTLRLAERYAEFLQVGFLGFQRLDGKVQDTAAAAVLTTKAP